MVQDPDTQGTSTTGLSVHRRADHVLEVVGEIDVATSPMLRSELADLLSDTPGDVTLDFAQVSFIDSSGLGVLVGALKRLRDTSPESTLRVVHARGAVRNVFDITGLDELFELLLTPPRRGRHHRVVVGTVERRLDVAVLHEPVYGSRPSPS